MAIGATIRIKIAANTKTSGMTIFTPAFEAASSADTLRRRRDTSA
jgi:hypothetical protein